MSSFFNPGAFSVWFGRKGKGPLPLEALEHKAVSLKEQSVHKETDPLASCILISEALEAEYDISLPLSLRISLILALEELCYLTGLFFDPQDYHGRWDEKSKREYLNEMIRLYEGGQEAFELLGHVLEAAFSHILGRLSRDGTALLSESPLLEEGPSLRVIDLVADPAMMVERIIMAFYVQEVQAAGHLKGMQKRFDQNTRKASGIYADETPKMRNFVLPTNYCYDDPAELVGAYLSGTPFAPLLLSPLPVAIPDKARFEHCHILGGSGHGKTTLLSALMLGDIEKAMEEKRSVVLFDSQGDLINDMLSRELLTSPELREKVIIVDPTDYEHPIALNPFAMPASRMESYSPAERERVLFSAVDLFEHVFSELMDAELTAQQGATFKYLIRLLLEIPHATLLTLREVMDKPEDFIGYMENLDGAARLFFQREFLAGGYKQTRVQISKRIWQLLSNPVFERLFSCSENKLDWFEALQDGSIIFVNTAKEYLKGQNSALFGKLMMAQIAQGILERASVPERKRTPTFIYLDEAQEYIDPSVEVLLLQGRKYACSLSLAHQHLDQLSSHERSTVLANTSVKLSGGLNRKDAQTISGETHSSPEFYQGLTKGSTRTQFGLYIRHQTSTSVPLSLPLGILQSLPRADNRAIATLRQKSKDQYGQNERPQIRHEPFKRPSEKSSSVPEHPQRPPAPQSPGKPTHTPVETNEPLIVSARKQSPTHKDETKQPAKATTAPTSKSQEEHRYLQHLVKGLAEDAGARASLEAPTEGGRIDVLIQKGSTSIAVEVGLTTTNEHELENVRKCLKENVEEVWVVTKGKRRLANLKKTITNALSKEEKAKLRYYTPELLPEAVAPLADIPLSEHSHRNYRVKVKSGTNSGTNQKRSEVAKILARSIKRNSQN